MKGCTEQLVRLLEILLCFDFSQFIFNKTETLMFQYAVTYKEYDNQSSIYMAALSMELRYGQDLWHTA